MHETINQRTAAVVDPRGLVQTRLTEGLLRAQEGICDASVWFDDGELVAHVTVHEESNWTPQSVQRVCMEQIGLHQTPRRVYLVASRPTGQNLRLAA